MISKGANHWNESLSMACYNGHMEVVKLLISKGANDLNYGLHGACAGGKIEIIELMISKGANNFKELVHTVYAMGHKETALIMLIKYVDINNNFSLDRYDLEYLVKANYRSFGKYSSEATKVQLDLTKRYNIIYIKVIGDLTGLIMKY
jgi:ankyrin repeat protein